MRILLLFIIPLISCIVYPRLSNYGQVQLFPGDSLVSTEGIFIATLGRAGCAFEVKRFIGNDYQTVGTYSPGPTINSCNSLTINGSNACIYTDSSQIYLALNKSCNISNFLIDDNGIFHLTCTPQNSLSNGDSMNITLFKTENDFLQSAGHGTVDSSSILSSRKNLGGWDFSASGGLLKISNPSNTWQSLNYKYSKFSIHPSSLLDAYDNPPPKWTSFPQTRFQPRCGYLNYFNFLSPYVFSIDPYWPIFTVKDQTGYTILKLSYPNAECVKDYGMIITQQSNCVSWVCPQQLFQFKGSCVTTCPPLYFHFIKRNESRCVLNCESGSTINNNSRICTCGSYIAPSCPFSSSAYPSGCSCNSGFYDGINCLQSCPIGFLANNGICLNCPTMCAKCNISTSFPKVSYLSCTQCLSGYKLEGDKCMKICNPLLSQTLLSDGTCRTCSDPNCADCTISQSICSKCTSFYVLQNGVCLLKCPTGSILSYVEFNNFVCLAAISTIQSAQCLNYTSVSFNHTSFVICKQCPPGSFIYGSNCVQDCRSFNSILSNDMSSGICRCPLGQIMINTTCHQMSMCPIKMAYYHNLGMCLSCPYGCLTCIANSDPIICTSCTPGFIFFAYSFPYCGFNSPYYQCINDYSLVGNYSCLPNNPTNQYLKCVGTVNNCRVCVYNSLQTCMACKLHYYLFDNTCISKCPSGTFEGQGQCLALNPFAPNCLVNNVIKSWSSYSNINNNLTSYSSGYNYYIFNGYLPDNNPIGSIFTSAITPDLSTRQTYVRDAGYYCPKCIDGFAADYYGRCIKCPSPCATCVIADVRWCITCLDGSKLIDGRTCGGQLSIITNTTTIMNIDCSIGQFKKINGLCYNKCQLFHLQHPYNGFNCLDSCPSGFSPCFDYFSNTLWCNQTINNFYLQQSIQYWNTIYHHGSWINGQTSYNSGQYGWFFNQSQLNIQNNWIYQGQTQWQSGQTIPQGFFYQNGSINYENAYSKNQQKQIVGYDCDHFLQLQSAIYRKSKEQTLAYIVPFQPFRNPNGISFPQYYAYENNAQVNSYYSQHQIHSINTQYLLINMTGKASHFLVNFGNGAYQTLVSTKNTYPANLHFGMTYGTSRPQTVWKKWVGVGSVFSIILLLLHLIYIGNDVMYKVDNTLILAQTIFLGQFTWAVMPLQMAQFFWGWFFAHLGFIPNIFRNTIPSNYSQPSPIAYKLVTEDANIIRNAGFAFTCLVFFLGVFILVYIVTLLIRRCCMKYQVWWPQILQNSLIAFLELMLMIIFYWSITQLKFGRNIVTSNLYFNNLSFGIAILFIILIIGYSIGRFFFSLVGGIYCLKRITIAVVFACSQNGSFWVCFIFLIQIVFFILRIFIQKPFLLRHKLTMLIEQVLIIAVYFVLIFGRRSFTAVSIVITIIICVFTLYLALDLFTVYLQSRNQWDCYEGGIFQSNSQVIIGSQRIAT